VIPSQLSADVIEFLRPASVVRRLNPNTIPMPNGNLRIPKVTGGSSASYQGENQNISQTQLVVGQVALTFKKLTALVPASNDLLRYSGPGAASADAMIRDDVVRAIAQRENQAFLRDDGSSSTPKGILNWAAPANVFASNAATLAGMVIDLGAAILRLMNNNIPEGRWAWIMSPRNWNSLMTVQNTNGFFVFRDEMSRGTLWGYPFAYTTQMPGSGTTGEMYLVNMADAIIGDSMALQVDVSMEASYIDANSSSLVSAFSLDQSIVRAITEHDFAMRRGESVAVINTMSW
jgi:HK97 family phage major capsid protein